jgi:hypothetical protein
MVFPGIPQPVVNGSWIYGSGGAAIWKTIATTDLPSGILPSQVSYGTSLPASPYDGQEAILVDNVAGPSYTWRFRYNAGSGNTYKWEFIGGNPKLFSAQPNVAIAAGAWVSAGNQFTFPRTGLYQVSGQATVITTAVAYVICGPGRMNDTSSPLWSALQNTWGAVNQLSMPAVTANLICTAGAANGATVWVYSSVAGSTVQQILGAVLPVQV